MKKKQKVRRPQTASNQTSTSRVTTNTVVNPSKSIRTERPFVLPLYVRKAIQKLDEKGHVVFVVGGSVRDFLMQRESKDHDLVTSALPDEICAIFPNAVTVGKAFGVIKVPTQTQPPLLEIATFREDLAYSDHRHPKGVVFSGPGQDALRRDFTINGLLYDPKSTKIIDYVGGLADIKSGVLKAIGQPEQRFREDALRLLRAVRFQTLLGLDVDPHTAEAIKSQAYLIGKISPERIRDELSLMWMGPRPGAALKALSDYGLLRHVLPEVEATRQMGDAVPDGRGEKVKKEFTWKHLLKTLDYLSKQSASRSLVLGWGAVLHEIGRPAAFAANEGKNFKGHEMIGAKMALAIATRLKIPRNEAERISGLVADHLKFREAFQMREATLKRFVRQNDFEDLLRFHAADAKAWDGNMSHYEFCLSRFREFQENATQSEKLLDGKDLIQMGFFPGPLFSEILRVVEDLTLERKLLSKEQALEYVVQHFVK